MKKRYKSYKLDKRHVELEIEELKDIAARKVEVREERDKIQAEISELQRQLDNADKEIIELEQRADEQEQRIIYLMNQQGKAEVVVDRVRYYLSKDKTSLERELILPPRS